ncbi:MAG: hypothetical protein LBL41_03020 [Bifidobacteriaceae bacterium]|jgi:hypothetical protein|nr:hypothetical protein [Bifidobacteriaceae bacterium]
MSLESVAFVVFLALGVIEGMASFFVRTSVKIKHKRVIYAFLVLFGIVGLISVLVFAEKNSFSWATMQNAFLINSGGVIFGAIIFHALTKLKLFGLKDESD